MTRKINGHEYAQVFVRYDDNGNETLVSYTTPVITIRDSWLRVNGLYSRTTIKHIGWFMREHGFDYYLAKKLYTDNMIFNIHTGEVKRA